MNKPVDPSIEEMKARMQEVLSLQKRANLSKGPPDARLRKDRLTRCITLLLTHKSDFVEAMNADFGVRSKDMTTLTDIAGAINPLKSARENLETWMKPQKRKVTPAPLALFGAKAEVRYQPKGVVGVISLGISPCSSRLTRSPAHSPPATASC